MIRVIRETHQPARFVAEALRLAGGCNRFGEPNYRAAWGWSRLTWIGGKWEDRDAEGKLVREAVELRLEPKYTPHDRWHIERWCAPESYGSPEEWYAQTLELESSASAGASRTAFCTSGIPALGPYPSRGEYEHCFTLEGPGGEFVQLTPAIARYVARAIEFSRALRAPERRRAIEDRVRREERAYDSYADSALSEAGRAFHGVPHITVL